ncbi:MAG: T9SS type A sorting domain-containing protein [Flavobacteriales bacterium]|nr:T9SS type A sorting domain-containing protein [Flavobacteriales bacterium]
MRLSLLSILIFIQFFGTAQIVIEHSQQTGRAFLIDNNEYAYGSANHIYNTSTGNITITTIKFIDENYSNISSFVLSPADIGMAGEFEIINLTYANRYLFDLDSDIEILIRARDMTDQWKTVLLDQAGNLEYDFHGLGAFNFFETSNSAKLQFNDHSTTFTVGGVSSTIYRDTLVVYDLPGRVPCNTCGGIVKVAEPTQSTQAQLTAFPNPFSNNNLRFSFEFPANINSGQVEILDMQGKLIRSISVFGKQGEITLNKQQFPQGTYLYNLKDSNGNILISNKMVSQ